MKSATSTSPRPLYCIISSISSSSLPLPLPISQSTSPLPSLQYISHPPRPSASPSTSPHLHLPPQCQLILHSPSPLAALLRTLPGKRGRRGASRPWAPCPWSEGPECNANDVPLSNAPGPIANVILTASCSLLAMHRSGSRRVVSSPTPLVLARSDASGFVLGGPGGPGRLRGRLLECWMLAGCRLRCCVSPCCSCSVAVLQQCCSAGHTRSKAPLLQPATVRTALLLLAGYSSICSCPVQHLPARRPHANMQTQQQM